VSCNDTLATSFRGEHTWRLLIGLIPMIPDVQRNESAGPCIDGAPSSADEGGNGRNPISVVVF